MEEVVCPKCHSNQISSNQKGFSTGNAVAGAMVGGAMMGMGMGMVGSNQIIITCLKCGDKFKAGTLGDKEVITVGDGTEIMLGDPFEFNSKNIEQWKSVY